MSEPALAEADTALLGVEHSVTGRRWVARCDDERAILALSQRHAVADPLARILAGRGVGLDEAAVYLQPRLRDSLPDPFGLRDMQAAAETIAEAAGRGATIGLLADYDVDGATSAALMIRYLRALGCPTLLHIPDRQREGYGPNPTALADLAARGAELILTLDCGTTAHDALATASVPVIVVDHHKAEPALPAAAALVNPNRLDEDGALGHLAAVGVVFLVAVAVNAVLRQRGAFDGGKPQPDLMAWLDLVALGTVCDVVPLAGLNRAFVSQGLKVMSAGCNPGLAALAACAKVEPRGLSADALGFALGPRINAGGRLGESNLGARLLSTGDFAEAQHLAAELDRLNQQRRETQEAVLAEARAQAAAQAEAGQPAIVAAGTDWHPGVAGIVAGRLAEQYRRPAFVFAGEGEAMRGSGRSAGGFDIGAAVIAARQSGLAQAAGGHREAAGATITATSLDDFAAFLRSRVPERMIGKVEDLALDGVLRPESVTLDLAAALERAAPFGAGNAPPRFALAAARLIDVRPAGERHLRCVLAGEGKGRLKAMAFRALDGGPLGPFLLSCLGKPLYAAGRIRREFWNGRENAEFHITDAAPA